MCGLSLVAARRGCSSLWCSSFSLLWLLLLRSTGSMAQGLAALWHVGSSQSRDRTHVPCVGRLMLSRFSCVRLSATPETAAHQAPPSPGFSRQEHWSGLHLLLQTFYDMNVLQKHHGKSKKPDKKTTHCMIPFI